GIAENRFEIVFVAFESLFPSRAERNAQIETCGYQFFPVFIFSDLTAILTAQRYAGANRIIVKRWILFFLARKDVEGNEKLDVGLQRFTILTKFPVTSAASHACAQQKHFFAVVYVSGKSDRQSIEEGAIAAFGFQRLLDRVSHAVHVARELFAQQVDRSQQ